MDSLKNRKHRREIMKNKIKKHNVLEFTIKYISKETPIDHNYNISLESLDLANYMEGSSLKPNSACL